MPEDKPDLTNEAHRVAREAVDAVQAFAQAAVNLPADVAKLALDAVLKATEEAKGIVKRAADKE